MTRAVFLLLTLAFVGGCASAPGPRGVAAPVSHVVLIDLKDPGDAPELIADCDSDLRGLPGVSAYTCGPRLEIGRPNVDGSYEVGLVLGFRSVRAYREYLDHPRHQALVAKWKPRWESIRIFDVQDAP